MDRQTVNDWIIDNMLDSEAWLGTNEQKQSVAVKQAERKLTLWYPETELVVAIVAYQSVWELQGMDPALKYQKHNVKQVTDNGESVSYKDGMRDEVAPDVRSLLGLTAEELAELEKEESAKLQYGGALI
jgi:phage terminase Nu1 subunit (DNA packaging protein)